MAQLVSVNVGRPVAAAWAGPGRTAIQKHPASRPVAVTAGGLASDEVADRRHHGGEGQAVYAFAREDLDRWETLLGRAIAPGLFGENLTTGGIDVNEAEIGERWRIGTALLEIASVRIPCRTFASWLETSGYDARGWVRRFTAEARPGAYLRVIEEGQVEAGEQILVAERPGHGVTVTTMFQAVTTRPELLPELLRVERLPEEARRRAVAHLASVRPPAVG